MDRHISYRKATVCSTTLGDELVLLHIESGKYFNFSKTARAIWEILDEPHSVDEVAERLITRFDVPLAQCSHETGVFMSRLIERGLLEPTE